MERIAADEGARGASPRPGVADGAIPAARTGRARRWPLRGREARWLAAPAAVLLFIFALRVLVLSASSLADVLREVGADGVGNFVGLGWLGAYAVLSGSPIAATALTLQDAGVIDQFEAFAQIAGSRMGASFIVLAVGFLAYLRGRSLADGVYVGVVAFLVTITTYIPVAVLGWLALDQGWLDGVEIGALTPITSFTEAVYDPVAEPLVDGLPDVVLFVAGVFLMLAALRLFDSVLPTPESTSGRLARRSGWLHGRWAMFGLGAGVTLVTFSVAVSLTLLVPLSRQGLIRREAIVPYVLGANITTFVDTLFAASVLESGETGTVVLAVASMATLVALAVLTLVHGPYVRAVNGSARWVVRDRSHLAAFIGAIILMPVVLLAV